MHSVTQNLFFRGGSTVAGVLTTKKKKEKGLNTDNLCRRPETISHFLSQGSDLNVRKKEEKKAHKCALCFMEVFPTRRRLLSTAVARFN